MTGHRLEVADVFRAHQEQSFNVGAMHSRTRNGGCYATSACAVQPHWALTWNAAIDATMRLSLMTRAGTGTVPSVSLQHAIAGCLSRLPACCRCPTSMRSSRCPNNSRHSAYATRSSSIRCRTLCAACLLLSDRKFETERVGSLLQAALRWSRTCAEVSGPLHPPCRHLQRQTHQPRKRLGRVSLARLEAQQPQQHDETRSNGVHATLHAPCAACRVRKDPTLWTACQPKSPASTGAVPSSSPFSDSCPRHTARRAATVCAQPILPPVSVRNPARHRTLFR